MSSARSFVQIFSFVQQESCSTGICHRTPRCFPDDTHPEIAISLEIFGLSCDRIDLEPDEHPDLATWESSRRDSPAREELCGDS